MEELNFNIDTLGEAKIDSPLEDCTFVDDSERTIHNTSVLHLKECREKNIDPLSFEIAGPRKKIFFNPSEVRSAIVTCGGLCPGLNDVIRAIVMQLTYQYNAKTIYGFRYGYRGLAPELYNLEPVTLTPEYVEDIHEKGGSILGSSRGSQDISVMADTLEKMKINILFCIGGDGTLRGANAIYQEMKRRGSTMSVIGVPKTIDNDIMYIEKSFGFETAFSVAIDAIRAAHCEADGYPNGVGLVKLMGRHSGFIAANAALALRDVNYVLVPEVPFDLEGPKGLFAVLEKRLEARKHAVIVVAEGAGQKILVPDPAKAERDASGNIKLGDIGRFLRDSIKSHFKNQGKDISLKYIDPSYIIRSAPANANDSSFCGLLGQMAVHAGMAGKTGMIVGKWNRIFTYVPIDAVVSQRKMIDPRGTLWRSVVEATGQPTLTND